MTDDHTDTPDAPLDADLRATDDVLSELFVSARPDPTLEDRVIRSLRAETAMPKRKVGWRMHPLTWGVAASIGLGAVGAAVSQLVGDGVPLPWKTDGWLIATRGKADRVAEQSDNDHKTPISPPVRNGFPLPRSEDIPNLWPANRRDNPVGHDMFIGSDRTKEADYLRGHMSAQGQNGEGVWEAQPRTWEFNGRSFGMNGVAPRLDDFRETSLADRTKQSGGQRMDGVTVESEVRSKSAADGDQGNGGKLSYDDVTRYAQLNQSIKDKLLPYYPAPTNKGKEQLDVRFDPTAYRWTDNGVQPSAPSGKSALPVTTPVSEANGLGVRGTTRYQPGQVFRNTGVQVADPVADPAPVNRKVILRSGDVEFEIESFDAAVATVTKLVLAIDGAFVATVNSEKLPNGKVKGSVAVRVPPDKLDSLVLDLRKELGKTGELKGQRIGSQDVTKQYTDLESRLRAARTMETRLLAIIKDGKGEIKQLLDAEKELGVWRTKIEEMEGEKRYFDNLAALSTLTITLAEKEIKAAAGVTESEVVQTGVEVEDVEQAFRDALAAVAAANGRVTKSDLKQVSSGQFNATLNFEIAPDAAGPVRDRLRQLGRVARLEITRSTTADAGTVTKDAKVKKGDTRFEVQLYNVTAMPPRETAVLTVAAPDVPARFRAVREAVEKAKGRVLAAALNESDKTNVTGQLDFEVKRADEAAVQAAIGSDAEVVSREVNRAAESDAVTDTKVLVRTKFVNPHRLAPRETISLGVETADVDAAGAVLTAEVEKAKGRVADSGTTTDRSTGRVTARYLFDVPLASAAGIAEKAKAAGTVKVNQVSRSQSAPDGRYATARIEVVFATPDRIVAPDDGFGPQVKKGLSFSVTALFASLSWLLFGLLVVLPWAVVVYAGVRVVRWLRRSPAPKV